MSDRATTRHGARQAVDEAALADEGAGGGQVDALAVRAFRRHARPPGGDERQMVRGVALVVGGFAGGDLLAHEHRRQVSETWAAFVRAGSRLGVGERRPALVPGGMPRRVSSSSSRQLPGPAGQVHPAAPATRPARRPASAATSSGWYPCAGHGTCLPRASGGEPAGEQRRRRTADVPHARDVHDREASRGAPGQICRWRRWPRW